MGVIGLDKSLSNGRLSFANTTSPPDIIDFIGSMDVEGADILLTKSTAEEIRKTFPLNSFLRQLIDESSLSVYAVEGALPTLAILEDRIHYKVTLGTVEQFIEVSQPEGLEALVTEFDALVADGSVAEFDTPRWDLLLAELEKVVGKDTRIEFERLILAAQHEELGALDEAAVAVIATAQSGGLQYDLGKWAEETNLASKATISRKKTSLESDGVIVTESVPVEVGRPRERLHLSEDVQRVEIEGASTGTKLDISMQSRSDSEGAQQSPTTSTSSGTIEDGDSESDSTSSSETQSDILATMEKEIRDVLQSN